jgi:serine/threonine protein kinase
MNDPQQREESLFNAALQLPDAAERAAYLKKACGDDESLRRRVEALLQAHEQTNALLDKSPIALGKTIVVDMSRVQPAEKIGDRIGRYKLREQIGEGGCGVVYVAEQEEPVRRRVALKVIKLGMDTKQVIARFEAERQALALMDHPNIAKVLDAGATEAGRPYFVMELVRGIRITDYCDTNNLSTAERLKLFNTVCQAIQHAHQKGIIHRDIKPSNILVTPHDGVPVPKVIDFGIAKATEGRLTDLTIYTELHQFIGTPAYMSPEQAEMSGLDIDTRSDIYALGVLLYELLTGSPPFDAGELMASGLEAMRRTIREKEPARPSTRLSTMLDADLSTIARKRQSDSPKLVHQLRGDLDWIVMKALEKDRTRRYETASGFAADIQRHLQNEPVVARPASNLYRFQKMVRRNKLGFVATSAVVFALVAGIVVSSWQAIRATRAEREQSRLREAAQKAQATEVKLRQKAELETSVAELTSCKLGAQIDKITAQQMTGAIRAMYFEERRKFWREALASARPALEKYRNDERIRELNTDIHGAFANACFEAGDKAEFKKAAQAWLDSNANTNAWYYGNVIHGANALLGRAALQDGDAKTAGDYLLKAGRTPGSPQLDSFGPDFTLAAQLLAASEKQVVLEYLDLVEKFWTSRKNATGRKNAETLAKWREDIRADRTPQGFQWPVPANRKKP